MAKTKAKKGPPRGTNRGPASSPDSELETAIAAARITAEQKALATFRKAAKDKNPGLYAQWGRERHLPGTPKVIESDIVFHLYDLAELFRIVGPRLLEWRGLPAALKAGLEAADRADEGIDLDTRLKETIRGPHAYVESVDVDVDDLRDARHAIRRVELFLAAVKERLRSQRLALVGLERRIPWDELRSAFRAYELLERREAKKDLIEGLVKKHKLRKRKLSATTIRRAFERFRRAAKNPIRM